MITSTITLILMLSPSIDINYASRLSNSVRAHCKFPRLGVAVMYTESRFNFKAINKNTNGTYDYGIFQINSIHGEIPMQLEDNIKLGCKILNTHYNPKDKFWFGKYFSKTPKLKQKYANRINETLRGLSNGRSKAF